MSHSVCPDCSAFLTNGEECRDCGSRLVKIKCRMMRESETAIAIAIDASGKWHWVPKSQVRVWYKSANQRHLVTVAMPIWMAKDRGIKHKRGV